MNRYALKTLLTGAAMLFSVSALADMNPFGAMALPLNKVDYQEMGKASGPLLNDDSLPIGTTREWSNASSGNHGTVKLLARMQKQYQGSSLPCRQLEYHVVVAEPGGPYNVVIDRCKVADGSWKIY